MMHGSNPSQVLFSGLIDISNTTFKDKIATKTHIQPKIASLRISTISMYDQNQRDQGLLTSNHKAHLHLNTTFYSQTKVSDLYQVI